MTDNEQKLWPCSPTWFPLILKRRRWSAEIPINILPSSPHPGECLSSTPAAIKNHHFWKVGSMCFELRQLTQCVRWRAWSIGILTTGRVQCRGWEATSITRQWQTQWLAGVCLLEITGIYSVADFHGVCVREWERMSSFNLAPKRGNTVN